MSECNHDFIVYANGKFGCRDCEYCEEYLPGEEPAYANYQTADIRDMMDGFKRGMATLAEAADACSVSVQEFAEAVKKTFRPVPQIERVNTIGGKTFIQVVGYEPCRNSCPLAIDDYFSRGPDISNSCQYFPDIINVSMNEDMPLMNRSAVKLQPLEVRDAHLEIQFCDGSIQRVKS